VDEVQQPGWVGHALAFLALLQVGFVTGYVRLQMC